MRESTVQRHFALRHHLDPHEAGRPATPEWVRERVAHYAEVAGVGSVLAVTDASGYEAVTGRGLRPHTWGEADWGRSRPVVFVDPAKTMRRGVAELVVAHEVGHLRWRSYGHRAVFFLRVQQLIDQAAGESCMGQTQPSHRAVSGVMPTAAMATHPLEHDSGADEFDEDGDVAQRARRGATRAAVRGDLDRATPALRHRLAVRRAALGLDLEAASGQSRPPS